MAVLEIDSIEAAGRSLVGPVVRAGPLAEAVIEAVADDNPDRDVFVLDRDDYVRVHTHGTCRLTRDSLERHLGRAFPLAALEVEMPSFTGRLRTRTDAYVWFYDLVEEDRDAG